MPSSFETLPYTAQAFLATLFTWAVTAAGAALVFFFGSKGFFYLGFNTNPKNG